MSRATSRIPNQENLAVLNERIKKMREKKKEVRKLLNKSQKAAEERLILIFGAYVLKSMKKKEPISCSDPLDIVANMKLKSRDATALTRIFPDITPPAVVAKGTRKSTTKKAASRHARPAKSPTKKAAANKPRRVAAKKA